MSDLRAISRRAAGDAGLKHYVNGKPCPKGHVGLRYVDTTKCVDCVRAHVLKWQKENKEKRRIICKRHEDKKSKEQKLDESRRDHVTERQRREMRLASIAGRPRPLVCELCGDENTRRADVIAFDHCHKNNHFRGWLCDRCNVTIGAVEDKSDLLRKMADYLDRNANPGPEVRRLSESEKKLFRLIENRN